MSTLAVNTITNAAGGNTAQINGMTPTADSLQGFRNRIINGDMRIDQRNAGASVTAPVGSSSYVVDRFTVQAAAASKFTAQQNAGAVTPPASFTNYLGMTSSSAYTPATDDFFICQQWVEGLNAADLGWGTASAQTVTISFWVRSSLTGTFAGSLNNADYSRAYPFTFSIASANTWTQISVTVAGDTSGTWLKTNGRGIGLHFNMGAGSGKQGTANAWNAGFITSTAGAVNLVATSGATFYITGVQLEAGSVATPFERRPYGTELALCQRYFWTIRGDVDGLAAGIGAGVVRASAAEQILYCAYPATMRASPTLSGATIVVESSGLQSSDSLTGAFAGRSSARLGFSIIGLTANAAAIAWLGAATSAAFLNASAEL
jgi:hypothetical protein